MSAGVGKIITFKDWHISNTPSNCLIFEKKRKLRWGRQIGLAIFGVSVFLIDYLWLRIHFMAWLGPLCLIPLLNNCFIYHSYRTEIDKEKKCLYQIKKNQFHNFITKIALDKVIAIEVDKKDSGEGQNNPLFLVFHLSDEKKFFISLNNQSTSNEEIISLILEQTGFVENS